jgi:hypothetical protein
MQQWEYQIIEVLKGEVDSVNGELLYKTPAKGLSGGARYTLSEYLAIIGDDGWEVIGDGTRALLYKPDHSLDYHQQAALIAKRPKE